MAKPLAGDLAQLGGAVTSDDCRAGVPERPAQKRTHRRLATENQECGMTKITVDPELRAKLGGMQDLVEFRDESGRVVGFFHPVPRANVSPNQSKSPISDEEIEAARQQRTGRPLADIFADLDSQG